MLESNDDEKPHLSKLLKNWGILDCNTNSFEFVFCCKNEVLRMQQHGSTSRDEQWRSLECFRMGVSAL